MNKAHIEGLYGYSQGGRGPHLPAVEEPEPDWQQMIGDIHGLHREYVLDHLLRPVVFILSAGGSLVIDTDQRDCSLLSVTVTTGTLDLWIGERGGVQSGSVPHARYTVTGSPQHLPLPPQAWQITLFASNNAGCQGCVIFSTA